MHAFFLQQALDLACANVNDVHGGGPFGALIVKDGQVIAQSGNRVSQNLDPTAHAEIVTIRLACQALGDFQLAGCVLYSSCEPCPMCLGAVYWARLAAVYYAAGRDDAAQAGFDDRFIYDELATPSAKRHIPMRQLTLADALQPFQHWALQPTKVWY